MQLMIYVGGTLVLLIFGVMLTAQGPFISMKTGGGDWVVALLLSGCAGRAVGAGRVQRDGVANVRPDDHAAVDEHAAGRRRKCECLDGHGRAR